MQLGFVGIRRNIGFGEIGFGEIGFGEIGFGETGFGEIGGHRLIYMVKISTSNLHLYDSIVK